MTVIRRYRGWHLQPLFAPVMASLTVGPGIADHTSDTVALAIDDSNLTLWIGEPATVWQTPLTEVRNLEIELGRRLQLRATIAGVRYTWTTRRSLEHDELIETVRRQGGRVVRRNRTRLVTVATVALALLVASVASITTLVSHSDRPTVSQVGAINVQRTDLPTSWTSEAAPAIANVLGRPGQIVTSSTVPSTPLPAVAAISNRLTADYESCMGVTAAQDRMLGAAGVMPLLQVTGSVFGSVNFNTTEIGSLTQYYDTTAMVNADVAQYSRAKFGRCWALEGAQSLLAFGTGSVKVLDTPLTPINYTPVTFARAWRRGGTVTFKIPALVGTYTLVSVLAAQGHHEVAFYALTGDWPRARPVIEAALAAVLGRLAPGSSSGAA